MNLSVSGSLSGLIGDSAAEIVAKLVLDGVFNAESCDSVGRLVTRGTLVLVEDSVATLASVEQVPVPMRAVSPQGTITTSGYDLIEAGLTVVIEGRSVPGGLRLAVHPEVSQVSGYVEDYPIVASRSMDVSCMVGPGCWVVLAGLDDWRSTSEHRGHQKP